MRWIHHELLLFETNASILDRVIFLFHNNSGISLIQGVPALPPKVILE
jgi:hypothetical protein